MFVLVGNSESYPCGFPIPSHIGVMDNSGGQQGGDVLLDLKTVLAHWTKATMFKLWDLLLCHIFICCFIWSKKSLPCLLFTKNVVFSVSLS